MLTVHFTNKHTQTNDKTCPKNEITCIQIVYKTDWFQLISANAWWFCNVFFFSKEFQKRSTIPNCTMRNHFLCLVDTVILGIYCRIIIVSLNMFSEVCWKNVEVDLRGIYTLNILILSLNVPYILRTLNFEKKAWFVILNVLGSCYSVHVSVVPNFLRPVFNFENFIQTCL